LQWIVERNIQNVVFLSGDIHCSNIAEMFFRGTPEAEKIKAFSITSSAFYWPYPFAAGEPNDYVHDSRGPGQEDSFEVFPGGVTMDYRAWNFTQEDNFCRVDIDKSKAEIKVTAFDYDGRIIEEATTSKKHNKIIGTLKLEPW
jgi:alkaline phosphatase D